MEWYKIFGIFKTCRFAFARATPSVDSSQDIVMMSVAEGGGATTVSFTRPFTSTDTNDRSLTSSYVLWAFNDDEANFNATAPSSIGYHGGSQRGVLANSLPSLSMCMGECRLTDPGNYKHLIAHLTLLWHRRLYPHCSADHFCSWRNCQDCHCSHH